MAVMEITQENFEREVLSADVPVLVDFWAGWCGPCRMLAPVVEEIESETPGLIVGKLNVDEQPGLATRYGVMSIPTLMLFRHGEVTASSVGVHPKAEILKMLSQSAL